MIPNWLIQRAYLTPDKIALSFEDEKWTFAQLKEQAMTIARKLRANGLREGERIALLGPSNAEMVFITHACMLAGLEIVMLNSRLRKKELGWQLDDSEATAVIVADELKSLIPDTTVRHLLFSTIKESAGRSFRRSGNVGFRQDNYNYVYIGDNRFSERCTPDRRQSCVECPFIGIESWAFRRRCVALCNAVIPY